MKVCNDYRLLIQLYIDGELFEEERRVVEQHLSECSACRRYCDEICMVNRAVQDVEIPKELHAGIMAAVAKERAGAAEVIAFPEAKTKKRPARRWIGTVAAMLAVACVGAFGMENGLTSMFSGMTKNASAEAAQIVTETTMEAPKAEEKSVEQAVPEAEMEEAPVEVQPFRIEESMASWFVDTDDHVDVMNCNVPVALEEPEVEASDAVVPDEADDPLNDSRMESLAAMVGDKAGDYGFCLVTVGSIEQLPTVFADQAEEAINGLTLVITVRNDPQVCSQIGEIMAECGFEVRMDTAAWFPVCADAAEGLVIVDLTE
ncbi:MAG: zf-HC2 domain-containing protein [Clostridia bacterium]|nr:zf-HC2 domain-containing protein [Clostridia bacterium]